MDTITFANTNVTKVRLWMTPCCLVLCSFLHLQRRGRGYKCKRRIKNAPHRNYVSGGVNGVQLVLDVVDHLCPDDVPRVPWVLLRGLSRIGEDAFCYIYQLSWYICKHHKWNYQFFLPQFCNVVCSRGRNNVPLCQVRIGYLLTFVVWIFSLATCK